MMCSRSFGSRMRFCKRKQYQWLMAVTVVIQLSDCLQMENELRELEPQSVIEEVTVDEIWRLSEEVLKDCQLKKGKKAKFIKNMEKVSQLEHRLAQTGQGLEAPADQPFILALASLLKNVGKLGEHEESLVKASQLISKLPKFKPVMVRWLLQFAALKSSKKQHQECYEIAVQAFHLCQQILTERKEAKEGVKNEEDTELLFIERILELSKERTRDEIIWLVNDRSLAEETVEQIKKGSSQRLHVPYYPTYEFHIADYMSLEECPREWEEAERQPVKEVVVYLSISCFTMATEKYYLKDYSQKYNHLKALRLALCAFDLNCSYVAFLLKILNQHFGKRMEPIEEEHFETAERYEMKRVMPKDKREVNLKFLRLPDE